jgi:hypothetical protein
MRVGDLLGGIEVSIRGRDGRFHPIGVHAEVGPIAREVQLVPLPEGASYLPAPSEPLEVRLTMTAGNWKLDQVGLAELGEELSPRTLEPQVVLRDGSADPDALRRLTTPGVHLITYPGDAYTLRFELPAADSELFLESRGYYYEWIRESWLKEESAWQLVRLFLDPRGAMQRLAPAYKRIEPGMERIFWQSRMGQP